MPLPTREQRIRDEIIVDAYEPEEQAMMGWCYYLERELRFPSPARCRASRAISPLRPGERVTVTGMAPEKECEDEVFVEIRGESRRLAVPLAQLEVRGMRKVDAATRQAVDFFLEQHGMSRGELAPIMGGRSRVSDFLRGVRQLSTAQMKALRDLLGVPAYLLLL